MCLRVVEESSGRSSFWPIRYYYKIRSPKIYQKKNWIRVTLTVEFTFYQGLDRIEPSVFGSANKQNVLAKFSSV